LKERQGPAVHWNQSRDPQPMSEEKTGLDFWMDRVLIELERARGEFAPDPVHDLRVAIRRCRSIADVWMALDAHPAWSDLRKEGKRLFRRLGDLRDVQVMMQWIRKIFPDPDPAVGKCTDYLAAGETRSRQLADKALARFNVKKWRSWQKKLAGEIARHPIDESVWQHLALERWMIARELHHRALRNRSQRAFHRLRIGLKRFRYTVENFLPQHHQSWGRDLKALQDALGEYHDLRVLWHMALQIRAFDGDATRSIWRERIEAACAERLGRYREMAVGRHSIWMKWRAGLPADAALMQAAERRLRTWASFRDPDFSRTLHVARLAMQLHDGVDRLGVFAPETGANVRSVLETAAVLQGVGFHGHGKKSHKASYREIIRMPPPAGIPKDRLKLAALAIRHHRGAFPRSDRKSLASLLREDRRAAILAAAILRLADAFDSARDGRIRNLEVKRSEGAVVVSAAGYADGDPLSAKLALARHPLETLCGVPILIRPQESADTPHPVPSP
jgi:CHAD domain-containing protein